MNNPARILVIEDNQTNRELMVYLLTAFGYVSLVAHDGVVGVEIARRELPDLIICDVHLPKRDGYDVVKDLKQDASLHHIPTVAVTAMAMVGDRDRMLAAGFDSYISKPIDPETFVQQVERFLPEEQRIIRTTAQATVSDAEPHSCIPYKTGATILVVDDRLTNIEFVRSALEPLHYRIIAATNVQEAFRLAVSDAPDLIFTDLHMPGLDDDDCSFVRMIRTNQLLKKIPIVILAKNENIGAVVLDLLNHRSSWH